MDNTTDNNTPRNPHDIDIAPQPKDVRHRRAAFVFSFVITIVCLLAGVVTHFDKYYVSEWWTLIFAVPLVLQAIVQQILFACFKHSKKRQKSADIRAVVTGGKSAATDNERKLAASIKRQYLFFRLSTWLFFIYCLACAFVGGITQYGLLLALVALFGVIAVVPYLLVPNPYTKVNADGTLPQSDFPEIYAVVNRAMKAVGIKKPVYVFASDEGSACIYTHKNCFVVELGAPLLALLNDEELYSVLLHELGHLTDIYYGTQKPQWLNMAIDKNESNPLCRIFSMFFLGHIIASYTYNYAVYSISVSERIEYRADQVMAKHSDAQVASDAMVKISYIPLYDYEQKLFGRNNYADEEAPQHAATVLVQEFLSAVATEKDRWFSMICKEISPQSSTHPLTRDRIAAMGGQMRQVDCPSFEQLSDERKRILADLDGKLAKMYAEDYAKNREEYYLKPKKQVDKWIANGKPDVNEDNRAIVNRLMQVDLTDQALAFCDRLIADKASGYAHAYYVRGLYRLHACNDQRGIDDMYAAVKVNDNYADEAYDEIAVFCCYNGLQQQLEAVRGKIDANIDNSDTHDQLYHITGRDDVEYEPLQGNRRNEIVDYIASIDDGSIAEVYLIRKKLGNEFCSPFIVRFVNEATPVSRDTIMHKIFEYLDNLPEDWNYSLNYYNSDTAAAVAKVPNSLVYSGKDRQNTSAVAEKQQLGKQILAMNKQIAAENKALKMMETHYSLCRLGIVLGLLGVVMIIFGAVAAVQADKKALGIVIAVVGGVMIFGGKYLAYRFNLLNIEQGVGKMPFGERLGFYLLSTINALACNKTEYARIKTAHEEELEKLLKQQLALREKFDQVVALEKEITSQISTHDK